MDYKYGNFLNGLSKFERMLEDGDKKYSDMVRKYWFLLLDQYKELKLGEKSEEYLILMKFKRRMMKVFDWPYHPKYNPAGRRTARSDLLDTIYACR